MRVWSMVRRSTQHGSGRADRVARGRSRNLFASARAHAAPRPNLDGADADEDLEDGGARHLDAT